MRFVELLAESNPCNRPPGCEGDWVPNPHCFPRDLDALLLLKLWPTKLEASKNGHVGFYEENLSPEEASNWSKKKKN